MYTTLLITHLMGAGLTGVQAIIATIALLRGAEPEAYRGHAKTLAILSTFTMTSGTLLAVVSTRISAAALCSNVAMYLGTLLVVEFALFYRMNQLKQPLPVYVTVSRLALGIAPFCVALIARV